MVTCVVKNDTRLNNVILTLVMMACLKLLFVKTIEKVMRSCTVLIFFVSGRFEDRAIFHVIQFSYDGRGFYVTITER